MASADPSGFFDEVWGRIHQAERSAGAVTERWFSIAGRVLKVRLIGGVLAPIIIPALRHLEVAAVPSPPDLTLHCWDCESLGVAFTRAPVGRSAFTPRGEVLGLNGPGHHTAFEPGGRLLSMMDVSLREAVYCVGSASAIQRFEVAEPIRAILSWFMRAHGAQLLHAGAVGAPDGGVLLIGRSGAGKSNTALGCLESELSYAADDFCIVAPGGTPTVHSLYCTGKTRESDWSRHPFLADLEPNIDHVRHDKVIYFLNDTVPHKLIAGFPLKAILLPRRGEGECRFRLVSPAVALAASAPDTTILLPDAGLEVMQCVTRLVRSVPSYEFQLGSNPSAIPGAISSLLAELS